MSMFYISFGILFFSIFGLLFYGMRQEWLEKKAEWNRVEEELSH